MAAFMVMHDSTLRALAVQRPATTEHLLAIRGLGHRKVEQFGSALLEALRGGA
jgi:superfamily II DNA helicase RecQ